MIVAESSRTSCGRKEDIYCKVIFSENCELWFRFTNELGDRDAIASHVDLDVCQRHSRRLSLQNASADLIPENTNSFGVFE